MEKERPFFQKAYLELPVIIFDVLAIPLAWFLACGFQLKFAFFTSELKPLLVLCCTQVLCYYGFGVYRGLWRFSSLSDVHRILRAVMSATLLVLPLFYFLSWFKATLVSVLPLYALLWTGLLSGARLYLRHYSDERSKRRDASQVVQRVMVIGAGSAGEGLIRDMQRTTAYLPVGIVDDGRRKQGLEVHGVRVLGTVPQLKDLVKQCRADLAVIAIPSASSAAMRRIVGYCEASGLAFRTLPSLAAITAGRVEVNTLQPVHIEDLLGRDQVELEWHKIEMGIRHRSVLVTGAGGSIGSELCRQIANLQPSKLVLLDNTEANLYHIEHELRQKFQALPIETCLLSVADEVAIKNAFQTIKPAIVFHAAAYKHVPMLEHQVRTAVVNNVLGTRIVAEASAAVNVEKFVMISTDKAVNPTNVMGATKRVAEIYCQNLNARVKTQFITVRFGNVLGSVGSVVPLFQKQLEAGGPLTVTHPEVKRYFMTTPEASQLTLQAMANGGGGEIFVLDMGEPINVNYLAEQMIRLAGKVPGEDIEITYTGLRPGEKLFEELFHAREQLVKTEHEKLFQARMREIQWEELTETFRLIEQACVQHEDSELAVLLKSLVPEFKTECIEYTA